METVADNQNATWPDLSPLLDELGDNCHDPLENRSLAVEIVKWSRTETA